MVAGHVSEYARSISCPVLNEQRFSLLLSLVAGSSLY